MENILKNKKLRIWGIAAVVVVFSPVPLAASDGCAASRAVSHVDGAR